jgi:hypothetical protein
VTKGFLHGTDHQRRAAQTAASRNAVTNFADSLKRQYSGGADLVFDLGSDTRVIVREMVLADFASGDFLI